MVVTKIYKEPEICKKEIMRYAGCRDSSEESLQLLLDTCLEEVLPRLSYKVCYIELPLEIEEDVCQLGHMQVKSKDLMKNLKECDRVILFAATIGIEIDRLIRKYGTVSPAKAVMLQAIGAERIESLCDAFCADIQQTLAEKLSEESFGLRPRFSPGYGDLPLEVQEEIFQMLNCNKHIGVSLNASLLMSPSKSVTAFIGIGKEKESAETQCKDSCAVCEKIDCVYRK